MMQIVIDGRTIGLNLPKCVKVHTWNNGNTYAVTATLHIRRDMIRALGNLVVEYKSGVYAQLGETITKSEKLQDDLSHIECSAWRLYRGLMLRLAEVKKDLYEDRVRALRYCLSDDPRDKRLGWDMLMSQKAARFTQVGEDE